MPLQLDRVYQVVEDSDGLHIVPTYHVISNGIVLLQGFSLMSCAVFAATYISQLVGGKDSHAAVDTAVSAMQAKAWDIVRPP